MKHTTALGSKRGTCTIEMFVTMAKDSTETGSRLRALAAWLSLASAATHGPGRGLVLPAW